MMANPHGDDTPPTGPYATAAFPYLRAGWSPLPLPPRAKKPVPNGWTGRDGGWPSGADVHAWTEDHAAGNIALRLPADVIGLDVDAYADKPGGLVLHHLEQTLGPLPATWRSTSRDDGTSGIRLYTVPPGLRWPGILGPGIETIRREHRYAVAWPSIHPDTGSTYRWITPDGVTSIGDIPTPETLPALPDAWVAHFTGGELAPDTTTAGLTHAATKTWLNQAVQGVPCRAVERATTRALTDLQARAGARHETALRAVHRLVWLAAEAHPGTTAALTQVQEAFLAATAGERSPGEAEAEFARLLTGSVDIAATTHPAPATTADPCTDPFAGIVNREDPPCPPSSPAPTSPAPSAGTTTTAPETPSAPAPATLPADSPAAEADQLERTTWWPRDTDAALDDDNPEPPPHFLVRDDGNALFYPARVNGIVAPSESGKTWVALLAVTQAVQAGHRCTVLDFEDSHRGVTGRLRAMGLTKTQIRDHVAYIGPGEPFSPYLPTGRDLTDHLTAWDPQLIILDGFNAAMTLQGLDLMSNKDATTFAQTILNPLARSGAAVVYIDHTPKDTENKTAGGIGAQAKRAMTTGCAIRIEVIKQFGKGQEGKLRLHIDKDRQGDVRGHSLPGKSGHWAGDVTIASTPDGDTVDVTLATPAGFDATQPDQAPVFRPTGYMERVSAWLADHPGAGRNEILEAVPGKGMHVKTALRVLVDEGWVAVEDGPRRSKLHTVVLPYSEAHELAGATPPTPPQEPSDEWGPSGVPSGVRDPTETSGVPGVPDRDVVPSSQDPTHGPSQPTPTAVGSPGPHSTRRTVERMVAGERVRIDLDTGEVID